MRLTSILAAFMLATAAPAALADPAAPSVAVGPQYDSTHVYVAPADFDRFVASFVATFGGTTTKVAVAQVTPTPSRTRSQIIFSPVGIVSVFGFETPIPWPFGSERNGYLVTDMDAAVAAARQAGADVVVAPFPDAIGRDALLQWPGGVGLQLYWHTTAPSYAPLASIPENRVYVSPGRADAFVRAFLAFSHGWVASDAAAAPGVEIGRPGKTFRRVRLTSTFGKLTVLVTDGQLPWRITVRQVKRLIRKYKNQGPAGLVSKHRDKPSNNHLAKGFKNEVINIIKKHYYDFGPTLASEKLDERDNIKISIESTRQLMIQANLWKAKKEKIKVLHPPRLRRGCYGELIQIDGSPHDWFEERGPRCTLLVFIDDATSRIQLIRFVPAETTFAYFNAIRLYIERYGKPVALYADKLGVFKVNAKEPKTGIGLTQFERAMNDLDIELLHANSAEAKGRVERANETLQDRLIKELRLRGISDMETANKFLEDEYTEYHNAKFAVPPRDSTNVHIQFDDFSRMDLIFTLQNDRTVSKNLTIRYKGRIFQINVPGKGYRLRQAKVIVCEWESGEITLLHNGQSLSYTVYDRKQQYCEDVTAKELDTKSLKKIRIHYGHKPAANHPWRKYRVKNWRVITGGKKPKVLDDTVGYSDIWDR